MDEDNDLVVEFSIHLADRIGQHVEGQGRELVFVQGFIIPHRDQASTLTVRDPYGIARDGIDTVTSLATVRHGDRQQAEMAVAGTDRNAAGLTGRVEPHSEGFLVIKTLAEIGLGFPVGAIEQGDTGISAAGGRIAFAIRHIAKRRVCCLTCIENIVQRSVAHRFRLGFRRWRRRRGWRRRGYGLARPGLALNAMIRMSARWRIRVPQRLAPGRSLAREENDPQELRFRVENLGERGGLQWFVREEIGGCCGRWISGRELPGFSRCHGKLVGEATNARIVTDDQDAILT